MTKKKLLNETTIRRWGKLANIAPLTENFLEEDETLEEEEELEEAHPSDVEARVKGLENLEKESLKKEILDIVSELMSEENNV